MTISAQFHALPIPLPASSTHVIGHGHPGRRELLVIAPAGGAVDEAARDAPHQQRVVDAELDHRVERLLARLEQLVQLLGLHHGARKAVQQEAARARRRVQVRVDQ